MRPVGVERGLGVERERHVGRGRDLLTRRTRRAGRCSAPPARRAPARSPPGRPDVRPPRAARPPTVRPSRAGCMTVGVGPGSPTSMPRTSTAPAGTPPASAVAARSTSARRRDRAGDGPESCTARLYSSEERLPVQTFRDAGRVSRSAAPRWRPSRPRGGRCAVRPAARAGGWPGVTRRFVSASAATKLSNGPAPVSTTWNDHVATRATGETCESEIARTRMPVGGGTLHRGRDAAPRSGRCRRRRARRRGSSHANAGSVRSIRRRRPRRRRGPCRAASRSRVRRRVPRRRRPPRCARPKQQLTREEAADRGTTGHRRRVRAANGGDDNGRPGLLRWPCRRVPR